MRNRTKIFRILLLAAVSGLVASPAFADVAVLANSTRPPASFGLKLSEKEYALVREGEKTFVLLVGIFLKPDWSLTFGSGNVATAVDGAFLAKVELDPQSKGVRATSIAPDGTTEQFLIPLRVEVRNQLLFFQGALAPSVFFLFQNDGTRLSQFSLMFSARGEYQLAKPDLRVRAEGRVTLLKLSQSIASNVNSVGQLEVAFTARKWTRALAEPWRLGVAFGAYYWTLWAANQLGFSDVAGPLLQGFAERKISDLGTLHLSLGVAPVVRGFGFSSLANHWFDLGVGGAYRLPNDRSITVDLKCRLLHLEILPSTLDLTRWTLDLGYAF